MIKIFDPLKYDLPDPLPDEISTILRSNIEKYFFSELNRGKYARIAEGFFRVNKNRKITQHNEYVEKKTREIYGALKNISDYVEIIGIDYMLDSGLMICVYILKNEGKMIGCIKGYRADKMTEDEFIEIWGASST